MLLKSIYSCKLKLILTFLSSVISVLALLLWNNQMSLIINTVLVNALSIDLIKSSVVIILLCTFAVFSSKLFINLTAEHISHKLRINIASRFRCISYKEAEELSTGEQISLLQNEISEISLYLRNDLFTLAEDIMRFMIISAWMLYINAQLAAFMLIPTIFLGIYTYFSASLIAKTTREAQNANRALNDTLYQSIGAFPIMHLFECEKLCIDKFESSLKKWKNAVIREERRRALLMSLSAFLSCVPLLILFAAGGTAVINGTETVGMLYAFLNLSGSVSGLMMNLPNRLAGFKRFSVNLNRLENSCDICSRGMEN